MLATFVCLDLKVEYIAFTWQIRKLCFGNLQTDPTDTTSAQIATYLGPTKLLIKKKIMCTKLSEQLIQQTKP